MKRYSQEKRKILQIARMVSMLGFCAILVIGLLLGSLFFIRPSKSEVEKRELTKFPSITMASFLDGSFFSDVSLWYSDTYPFRDSFISASNKLKTSYGPHQDTQMIGGNKKADEIPVDKSKKKKKAEKVDVPENFEFDANMQNQIMAGLYVKDAAAYSMYYFNQDAVELYAQEVINKAAKKLDGVSNVYSILVPNNAITLSKEEYSKLGGSDMEQAIDYYYSLYENATGIETAATLKEHSDEYLYFRTDHHWTALAAYYVYQNFCEEKGWEATPIKDYETMEFKPFLGTFYNELQLPEMQAKPDSVTAYIPNSTNDMKYWDENGNEVDWHIIEDVSSWNEGSGYYCFIGGDKPLSVIDNPKIDDGNTCLVIKESYGNAFIPFLVDHYDKVYIADFRYTNINITDFAKENKIDDVIFENNISLIGNSEVPSAISDLI